MLLPGSTIGVLGNGQLGRMLAAIARRQGYRVQVLSPDEGGPAGQLADREWVGSYDDSDLLRRFAAEVDVVTVEFENIPAATLEALAERRPVHPSPFVVSTAQHRGREKRFLADHGFPVAPFALASSVAAAQEAADRLGYPVILKTAGFGYDGKGQRRAGSAEEVAAALQSLVREGDGGDVIVESVVPFVAEAAVIVARGATGEMRTFDLIDTCHERHILDVSSSPSTWPTVTRQRAAELGRDVVNALGVVGVMCVELFVLEDGDLLVNELAPRPHNSGHLTIEAATTSQFEQQLRAICGLPLGNPSLVRPAAMANLLGDLWSAGEPRWERVAALGDVALHLYGKTAARPGRKMGHLTALAASGSAAEDRVRLARSSLIA